MSCDDSWVFDSLVCFLHGPIWNAPLQNFIEEKSLIFDPNLHLDEENPKIKHIHDEYKNLVDYMLGSFMEEMQITPGQFEIACIEGRNQQQGEHPFQFHQALFQQIWAANDMKIFIRMMTQRNVELQLQALDLIERNQLSFLADNKPIGAEVKVHDSNVSNDIKHMIEISVDRKKESPEVAVPLDGNDDVATNQVADKFERLNLFFQKSDEVDPDDVMSRQEYLRQQRDKIIEIKKMTRVKQLQDTIARNSANPEDSGRPSSAVQIAQNLLDYGGKAKDLIRSSDDASEGNRALQLRRTLAKRLRTEVVKK